jgi:hypothetical protein
VVDELPATVRETPEQTPLENPFGAQSQNSSVGDLSYPRGTSPDEAKPPGSPPQDFVNLSLRHGQLYDEKKGEGVTNIHAHSLVKSTERKQRGPLSKERREDACAVRKMRACFRCHSQRIRVSQLLRPLPLAKNSQYSPKSSVAPTKAARMTPTLLASPASASHRQRRLSTISRVFDLT